MRSLWQRLARVRGFHRAQRKCRLALFHQWSRDLEEAARGKPKWTRADFPPEPQPEPPMPSVREHLARALTSRDLGPAPARETHAERIGALAATSTLGSAVMRVRYSHDPAALRRLAPLLEAKASRRARSNDPTGILGRLAARALAEWLDDRCEHCHGRTWVQRAARRTPCRACSATGARVPRDADRAAALGLPPEVYAKHWAKRLDALLAVLRGADADAAARLRSQLERCTVRAQYPTTSPPSQSTAPRPPLDQNNMGARHEGQARPHDSQSPE